MSYEQGGKIQCHMSNSTLRPHRSTVRCPSFSFCIKSLTMQSYKPCSNFLVYALGGYAGVWASWNWQVHTKKKRKERNRYNCPCKKTIHRCSFYLRLYLPLYLGNTNAQQVPNPLRKIGKLNQLVSEYKDSFNALTVSQGYPMTISSWIHWKHFLGLIQSTFRSVEIHSK